MGGVDGFDWSVFGGNPTPGDPDGARAMASGLRNLAEGVGQQNRLLRSVGSDSHSVWVGPAADAFRPHVDKLPGQLDKLTTSYGDAADALDGYWPRLAAAQQQAVDALHKAQMARSQVQTAHTQVAQAGQAASSAADSYNQAASAATTAPPDPTGATAAHLSSLQTAYQAASSQLSGAHAALAGANANLQAAHAQADSARSQAKAAARQAAAGLHSASNAGIHNPHHSLFGSIVDTVEGVVGDVAHFAEHHWQAFVPGVALAVDAGKWLSHNWVSVLRDTSAVLGGIATVAGFVALVPGVGEIAMPVALVSALGATAEDAILAGTGNGKWSTVALDGVGDVGFGAGEMLGRSVDGINAADRLFTTSSSLESKTAGMTSQVDRLNAAAARWDAVGNQEVFQVGPTGQTVVTKGSELANEFRAQASPLEQLVTKNNAKVAEYSKQLAGLPGKGDAGGFKYALQTFQPGEEGNTFSKVAQFVKSPSTYSRSILQPSAVSGNAAVSGFRQVTGAAAKEGWSGPAKTLFRINLGVGAAGTGLGTYQTTRAWQDAAAG